MEVFHLHRATNRALRPLPEDIAPLIKAFIRPTRLDWRTCRTHEADLIKRHQVVTLSLVGDVFDDFTVRELRTWTLCGVLYIIAWLNKGGGHGRPPRCRPTYFPEYYADNYDKWYIQTFMWCTH